MIVPQSPRPPVSPSPRPPVSPSPMKTIRNPHIPLAVYRELAAHLRQIEGVSVKFLQPIDRSFSYLGSQLDGLEISGIDRLQPEDSTRLDLILKYYLDRYNSVTN